MDAFVELVERPFPSHAGKGANFAGLVFVQAGAVGVVDPVDIARLTALDGNVREGDFDALRELRVVVDLPYLDFREGVRSEYGPLEQYPARRYICGMPSHIYMGLPWLNSFANDANHGTRKNNARTRRPRPMNETVISGWGLSSRAGRGP